MRTWACAALCLLLPAQGLGTSWPVFRRNAARQGRALEKITPPLTLRWTFEVPGAVHSSPVVGYGKVYFGSRSGSVYALDAYTGTVAWDFSTGDWVDATPAIDGGRVFVPSREGRLYALDAETGTLLWTYTTGATDIASPAVLNGVLYIATGYPQKKLLLLDAKTGGEIRSRDLSQFTASSPVIDKATGRIYLGTNDGRYNAFNADLTPLWPAAVQTRGGINLATPALGPAGLVAVPGDDDWKAHYYDPANGTESWATQTLCHHTNQATSVAVTTDTAFLGSGCDDHSLYGIDLSTGGVKWKVLLGVASKFGIASSPGVANDVVYVLSPTAELYAIHTATGGILARIPLGAEGVSSPAVANGWVYAATMEGKIYGFEAARAASISSPDELLDSPEGILTIKGTAASPSFQGFVLEYGTGTAPSQWMQLSTGAVSVRNGNLATWDVRELPDGVYTLRLTMSEGPPGPAAPPGGGGIQSHTSEHSEALASITISQVKTTEVDASTGTTISLGDGTELIIPAGALAANEFLTAKKLFSGWSDAGVPSGVTASDIVREFSVVSTAHYEFLKPVTIKIPYTTIAPKKEDNLRMFWFDDAKRKWSIVNTSLVVKQERRVAAEVDHFTQFRVMEFTPSSIILDGANVYTYPNPATGNTATFKFLVGDTSDVTVRVFDVSGTPVAQLEKKAVLGGTVSTIDWDIAGKASGVYLYRVEAVTTDGKKGTIKKKLAIIH